MQTMPNGKQFEQFFHFLCIQLMPPNIPKNLRFSQTTSNLVMLSLLGFLEYYSLEKIETTILAKRNIYSFNAVISPIFKYSFIKLAMTPYASILKAAIIYLREGKSNLLGPSYLSKKVHGLLQHIRYEITKETFVRNLI